MMKKFLLLLLALAALASPGWAAETRYVTKTGSAAVDGTQSTNPTTLEHAVEIANNGDVISVDKDIYEAVTLTINKSITLMGNGATLSLASGKTGPVIKIEYGSSVTIKDLTIKGGNNTGSGGGIDCSNTTDNPTTLTVTNCRFEGNNAGGAGAIYLMNGILKAEKCTFTGNVVTGVGGAICVDSTNADVSLTNCTFYNNNASDTDGLYLKESQKVTVNHCTFVNGVDNARYEIYVTPGKNSAVTVKNSIIYGDVMNTTPTDTLTLTTKPTKDEVFDKDNKVEHVVFKNSSELKDAVGKVNRDANITKDQLGNDRLEMTSIGAVEIVEPTHTHAFSYTAKDNVLTATCNGAGTCGLTDKKATLTLVAPTPLEYDGKEKKATVTGSIPGVDTPTIVYTQNSTALGGAPVNAGDYIAKITLGDATATVSFTITTKAATVTASDQTVVQGNSISTGADQATLTDALDGHTLSDVTLTADTSKVTTNGTITPSDAVIKDKSGNDVTANYTITYVNGKLTVTAATVSVTGVTLKDSTSLTVGGTETLTATVTPDNATNKNVTWKSGNTGVATVDANGKVTAVAAGTADITVTTEDGKKTATCAVTVTAATVAVTGVTVKDSTSLTAGGTETLTATVTPDNATNKNVTWKSGNTGVATVDDKGLVTAVAAGTADITVTTEDGKYTATCKVTVSAAPVTVTGVTVTLEPTYPNLTVTQGETNSATFRTSATATYSDDSTKRDIPVTLSKSGDWPGWITLSGNTITATPGTDVKPREYAVTLTAKASVGDISNSTETTVTYQVTAASGSIDLHFLTDPITMTVEQAGYAERMLISRRDYACDYVLDGQKASLAPEWSLESGPSWLRINEGVLVADLRKSDVKPGEYTGTLRATASYNGATATATAQVKVTVTGYTELEVTAPDAVMVVYPGCQESRLDLKPLITVKGKHSSRGWETVSYSSREIDQSGTWPSWLTIKDFVAVGKAPAGTEPGKYEYKYNVTVNKDNMFGTGAQKLIVYVSDKSELEPAKITMDSDALPYAQEGSPYSARIYTTGDEPIRWVVDNNTPLPDGLTLNESTGEISGTPTQKDVGQIKGSIVYVSNPANANNPDQRYFLISVRGVPPSDWRITRNPVRVSKGETFDITFNVQQGRSVYYSTVEYPDKQYLKKAIAQNASEAGEGSIKYTCVWPEKKEQKYKFQVKATNKYGWNTKSKIVTVLSTGKIKSAGGAPDYGVIIAEDDEDSETFEEYPDGYTPDYSEFTEGVTYFHNGGVDEDGNISAVIGTAATGVEGAEYVYADVTTMLGKLTDEEKGRVIALEFRKGATVTLNGLDKLTGLKEIAIDECGVTTLDLSGNKTLTSLSLYDCENLAKLDVSGCVSLDYLSVAKCPTLKNVNVDGCCDLEGVSMTGTAVTELNLSDLKALTSVNVNGCTALKALDVKGCSSLTALDAGNTGLVALYAGECPALADVDLNSTDIAEVDLSGCSGLKSLSLAGAPALTELKLPGSTAVEEITLTGSRIYSLPLSGSTSLISLDLNGSAILTSLDVSGCSSLRTLDVSRCVNLSTLNLSGCSALEKLAATGCVSLTSLSLTPGGHLRELNVGGANFLKSLEVGGQALGHLDLDGLTMLTAPNCSEQLISGVPMNRTLNMKNYVGNGLSRVSGIHGYAGDNTEIELTSWNGGVATFASVPDTVSYFYNTAGLNNKTMDVTLTLNGAPDGDGPTSNRGSGGGCDAGLGLVGLLAVVGLALHRRK